MSLNCGPGRNGICSARRGSFLFRGKSVQADPLIAWPEPVFHLVEFIGKFLAAGAVGFRFAALRTLLPLRTDETSHEGRLSTHAARRAAILGLVGTLITAGLFFHDLPGVAARAHVTMSQALHGDTLVVLLMLACAALGFVVATVGVFAGWYLALVGVVVAAIRGVFF